MLLVAPSNRGSAVRARLTKNDPNYLVLQVVDFHRVFLFASRLTQARSFILGIGQVSHCTYYTAKPAFSQLAIRVHLYVGIILYLFVGLTVAFVRLAAIQHAHALAIAYHPISSRVPIPCHSWLVCMFAVVLTPQFCLHFSS